MLGYEYFEGTFFVVHGSVGLLAKVSVFFSISGAQKIIETIIISQLFQNMNWRTRDREQRVALAFKGADKVATESIDLIFMLVEYHLRCVLHIGDGNVA